MKSVCGLHRNPQVQQLASQRFYVEQELRILESKFGTQHREYKQTRRRLDVIAEQLGPQAAGQVLVDFARRYPNEARMAGLLGFEVDGSEEDYREMGTMLPLIALRPR